MPENRYPEWPLSATALIEEAADGFMVWLCHDNPQDHPDNHSFVAGRFETFAAAVDALSRVRGLTIEKVYRGPKFGDDASLVVLNRTEACDAVS